MTNDQTLIHPDNLVEARRAWRDSYRPKTQSLLMRILLLTPIGASLITLALEKQGYDLIVAVLLETLSEVAGIYLFFRDRKRKRLAREKFEATFPDEASYVFLAENSD